MLTYYESILVAKVLVQGGVYKVEGLESCKVRGEGLV